MFELNEMQQEGAVIKVIGVGGGGGNAINNMALTGLEGVEFISANTDAQALRNSHAQRTLQLGIQRHRTYHASLHGREHLNVGDRIQVIPLRQACFA